MIKDILYISNVDSIKTLSNENRLKILNRLIDGEYTVQDLANEMNVKANVMWYDVKELERVGLIKIMHTEKVRGTVKKYYRATARNFFIDASFGQAELNNSRLIKQIVRQEIDNWRREKIIKIDFIQLANKIVNQCLGIQENEKVVISYEPVHLKLVEDLVVEISKKGAYAIPIFWTKRMEYNLIQNVPLKYAVKDTIDDFLLDKIDVEIIFSTEFFEEKYQLTKEMLEKSAEIEKVKRDNIQKTYKTKVRFLTIDTLQEKQLEDLDYTKCIDMYWQSLNVDIEEMHKECMLVKEKIKNTMDIEVKGKDRNKKLRIHLPNENNVQIKDGRAFFDSNKSVDSDLPGGIVICSLMNGNINGEITADYVFLYNEKFNNVNIRINNNKIVEIYTDVNNDRLQKIYNNASGDKDVITVFSIGLNPALRDDVGHPFIDPKIYGAFSMQVGWDDSEGSNIDSDLIAQVICLNSSIKVNNRYLFEKGRLKNPKIRRVQKNKK